MRLTKRCRFVRVRRPGAQAHGLLEGAEGADLSTRQATLFGDADVAATVSATVTSATSSRSSWRRPGSRERTAVHPPCFLEVKYAYALAARHRRAFGPCTPRCLPWKFGGGGVRPDAVRSVLRQESNSLQQFQVEHL